jgi:hypothetical protein
MTLMWPIRRRSLAVLTVLVLLLPFGTGCEGERESESGNPGGRQLSLCILLDLSQRVEPSVYPATPSHLERDLAVVGSLVGLFKEEMKEKKAALALGRIRTVFMPIPNDPEVNSHAQRLNIDLSAMHVKARHDVYNNIEAQYEESLRAIYTRILSEKRYIGADVWRFFKEGRVRDLCMADPSRYRNVLVIVTDGYIYHLDSRDKNGNRTAYITGPHLAASGLRNNVQWRNRFESQDFGLISTGQKLDGLEVLVVEVNPSAAHPNDYDIIDAYLAKWFSEMGVSKYRQVKTDLPTNTVPVIKQTLNEWGR